MGLVGQCQQFQFKHGEPQDIWLDLKYTEAIIIMNSHKNMHTVEPLYNGQYMVQELFIDY